MSENNNNDLNEVFEEEMDDADVITVPIDETLSNSGEAADAAAVGAALALKADKDELPATIKVNGQQADNQGLILINGTHIPVNGSTQKTLAEAVSEVSGMTAETIPMSEETGAATIAAEIEDIKEDVSDLQEAIDGMEEKTADNIPMETGSTTTVKNAIETLDRKAVKSVNRKLPDAAGDVDLSVVPLAENLQSDKLQSIEGEFIIRTTGGNGAVSDGKAYPQHIYGNCQHNGYVAEVLNLTVIPITRTEPDEPITATIDRDTFVAAVDESSTINLYYTTEWSEDPADYGVTVTGEPVAGDQITIVYVKEQRGTILVADPDRLVGTGWNLFNANDGYARVVKYSDVYGYKIGGTYTSIAFSATLTGDRTSLLPNANGLFNVPSDGYVFVTGGNATDTYVLATWSDWTNGPSTGYWEAYRESGIDLSAVVETYFPYGMLKIGTVRDEIDLVAKRSISRIERMVYSEENRAAAAATGRAYDFDESNIYIVRAEYVQNAITISTEYSVSEHGLEWFTETALPIDTEILYGKNLRDKLERDVLTISAQTLTEEEKAQARTNIGAMSQAEGDTKLVAPTAAGTAGQLLHLKADGGTEWTTQGTPTDAQVGTAVSAWLTAHPEATTTVQDGAISRAKLNDDLKAKTDAVPDLKSAFKRIKHPGDNIVTDVIYTQGGYYDTTNNNTFNSSNDWGYSDLIPCEAGKKYYLNTPLTWYIGFFNSDKSFNSGVGGTYATAPANAKYIQISVSNNYGGVNYQETVVLTVDAPYTDYVENASSMMTIRIDDIVSSSTTYSSLSIEPYEQPNLGIKVINHSAYAGWFEVKMKNGDTEIYVSGAFALNANEEKVFENISLSVIEEITSIQFIDTNNRKAEVIVYSKQKDYLLQKAWQTGQLDTLIHGANTVLNYGYITNDGTVHPQLSDSTNHIKTINNFIPNSVIVYSGAYTGMNLVYGYYADGTVVTLLESGSYENKTIKVTDTNIVTVKAWSDTTQKALKLDYFSIAEIKNKFDVMDQQINKDKAIIVVDANGYGDSTTIGYALSLARANYDTATKDVLVYIRNGKYTVNPSTTYPWAIYKGANRISIIGESRDGVIIELVNTSTAQNKVLEIGGPCVIQNLTIKCLHDNTYVGNISGNNPYCLHNDAAFTASELYKTLVKDCYFYSECYPPVGAGLRDKQTQIYENVICEYNNDPEIETPPQAAFYCHAPGASGEGDCSVVVDNCTFISKNGAKAIAMGNPSGTSTPYTEIPVTFRRTIAVTNGETVTDVSASTHDITMDSALNNVSVLNYGT